MENKVHIGKNVKRIREILGVKMEVLAIALNMTRQYIYQLETTDAIEPDLLERIARALNVPVETIRNFDDKATINIFAKTFNGHANATSLAYRPPLNFDAFEKWLEAMDEMKHLYAALLNSEREKVAMLERIVEKV